MERVWWIWNSLGFFCDEKYFVLTACLMYLAELIIVETEKFSCRATCVTYVRRIKHADDSLLGAAKSVIRRNACLLAASLICDRGGSCCRVVHIGREAGRMDKIIGDFFAFLVSCRSSYLYLDVVLGASGSRPTHTHTHAHNTHTHAHNTHTHSLTHAHGP